MRSKVIGFTLPPDYANRLVLRAIDEWVTPSELVRDFVMHRLDATDPEFIKAQASRAHRKAIDKVIRKGLAPDAEG